MHAPGAPRDAACASAWPLGPAARPRQPPRCGAQGFERVEGPRLRTGP
jgi:hypothetical protein